MTFISSIIVACSHLVAVSGNRHLWPRLVPWYMVRQLTVLKMKITFSAVHGLASFYSHLILIVTPAEDVKFLPLCLSVSKITQNVVDEVWLNFSNGWDIWLIPALRFCWWSRSECEYFLKEFYDYRRGSSEWILLITQEVCQWLLMRFFFLGGGEDVKKTFGFGAISHYSPDQTKNNGIFTNVG